MKSGLSLQELAAEIERQQASKVDYVLSTRRLQVVTPKVGLTSGPSLNTTLWIDGEEGEEMQQFGVTDHAHGQIAERLGIPKTFYDRLRLGYVPKKGKAKLAQPGVFDGLLNGLFQGAPEKRMVRTLDGRARAMLSDRYRPLDNFDLANAVLPIIAEWSAREDARVESCHVTDARLYLKVVLPRIQREVKLGDVVQSGFVIQNSEVGLGSLSVLPMIYRLSCLNGMIREQEGMKKYHVGRAVDIGEDASACSRIRRSAPTTRRFGSRCGTS